MKSSIKEKLAHAQKSATQQYRVIRKKVRKNYKKVQKTSANTIQQAHAKSSAAYHRYTWRKILILIFIIGFIGGVITKTIMRERAIIGFDDHTIYSNATNIDMNRIMETFEYNRQSAEISNEQ